MVQVWWDAAPRATAEWPIGRYADRQSAIGDSAKMEDTALHGNGDRLSAIGGAELLEDVLDVDLDRPARRAELFRNFAIAQPVGDQREHFGFAGRQRDPGKVRREALGHVGRHQTLP